MMKTLLFGTVLLIVISLSTLIYIAGITRRWTYEKKISAIKWTVLPMSVIMTLLVLYITDLI